MTEEERARDSARRLDGFVDAAFAFAVTLLLITGVQPPGSMAELETALLRIPASAAAFALIAMFWMGHRAFSRLAAARDGRSVLTSLAIVFVVLVYVFPLRLLTEAAFYWASGGRLPGEGLIHSLADLRGLYLIYGVGFTVLSGLYALLFAGAIRLAEGPEARKATEAHAAAWVICAGAGVLSAILALAVPLHRVPWLPPFTYSLIPVFVKLWDVWRKRTARPAPEET